MLHKPQIGIRPPLTYREGFRTCATYGNRFPGVRYQNFLAPVSELVQWNRIPKRPVSEGYQKLFNGAGIRSWVSELVQWNRIPRRRYQNLVIRTWFNGTGYQGADIRTWVSELGSMVAGPKHEHNRYCDRIKKRPGISRLITELV